MESSYGVGVANRFAIPDEEDVEVDDPSLILQSAERKVTEQKKEVKKPVAKGKAPEKSQPKSSGTEKPKGQNRGSDKQSQPRGERGERSERSERGERGERSERKPREGGERRPRREGNSNNRDGFQSSSGSGFGAEGSFGQDSSFGGETQSFGDRDTRERGRGRGRGGSRGGPRGAGAPREGRREFDRRSGNDRSSNVRGHEKREGGGARNWGNPVSDFGATEDAAPAAENAEQTTPAVTTEGGEGETKPVESAPVVEDEDAKLMTLDEYKRQQKDSRYRSELNVRKAGENEDLSKWKNTRRYERPAPITDEEGVEYVIEKKDQRSHSKQTIDLSFQFNVDTSSRGAPAESRGGRRGGRGGSRGGGRGAPAGREGPRDGPREGPRDGPRDGPREGPRDGPREGGRRERGGGSYNFRDDDFPALG